MQKYILMFLIVVLFMSCNSVEKDLDKHFENLKEGSFFTLDSIETRDWDTVCIQEPYSKFDEKQSFKISDDDRKNIRTISMSESYTTLIFIKDKKVINYGKARRNLADFSYCIVEKENLFSRNQKYRLGKNRIVSLVNVE